MYIYIIDLFYCSNPSPDHQALITSEVITTSKEIGVGTSESLPRSSDKKKSKKDKKEKEAKRDKERAQAEAIDKEILGKKASLERPKSKAPKPPKTYFTDNNKNTSKIDLPNTVSTSERKKNFLQSIENKDTTTVSKKNNTINTNNKKKQETEVQPAQQQQRYQTKDPEIQESANSNGNTTIEKKPSQKDRSVDVYHETVRQRVTRSTEAVKDVFTPDQDSNTNNNNKKAAKNKKQRAPQHPQKDINDEELPSVRELRSKFETSKSGGNKQQNDTTKKSREIASSSPPTSSSTMSPAKKSNKIDFKKGFNVMSSLTRRSAMSVSKSMQNLSIESKKEADQSKKHLDDANNGNIGCQVSKGGIQN